MSLFRRSSSAQDVAGDGKSAGSEPDMSEADPGDQLSAPALAREKSQIDADIEHMYAELSSSVPASAMIVEVADLLQAGSPSASLTASQTHLLRMARAAQLAGTLGLSLDDGELLLRAQKWDVERAVSTFLDDPVMTAEASKLSPDGRAHASTYVATSSDASSGSGAAALGASSGDSAAAEDNTDEEFMCEVCFACVP